MADNVLQYSAFSSNCRVVAKAYTKTLCLMKVNLAFAGTCIEMTKISSLYICLSLRGLFPSGQFPIPGNSRGIFLDEQVGFNNRKLWQTRSGKTPSSGFGRGHIIVCQMGVGIMPRCG